MVTVTSTVPEPFGETTTILVAETTFRIRAFSGPKRTAYGATRSLPMIVTIVPPDAGPVIGSTRVTAGVGA